MRSRCAANGGSAGARARPARCCPSRGCGIGCDPKFSPIRTRTNSAPEQASTKKIKPKLVKTQPTDRLFPTKQRELLNAILGELKLKFDRDGNVRTSYSLRHTYICFRLMEGADIYQIAKNCRTSVEMIEKFYAAHIKTMLDATAINVRRGTIQRERRGREGGHPTTSRTDRKTREGGKNSAHRRARNTRERATDQL